MVKTRGALEREKLKHEKEVGEVQSFKTCPVGGGSKRETEFKNFTETQKFGGSCKSEPAVHASVSSKKLSTKSSIAARKKQLELAAAEAKAKIEKELIDKRLAADIAAMEDEASQKSRCGENGSLTPSQKVEQWFEKSQQDQHQSRAGSPEPLATDPVPQSDFRHLAKAMEKLATATQSANTQLLSRLATPKDLPFFSGEPLEWLQFKKVYQESTKLCNYSQSENIARLNKCLRGEARDAVSSLLITDSSPATILEALELRFGRPELIINMLALQFKKLQPLPQNYHTELVNFAVKIKNYVTAAESLNQSDYLRSPELFNAVITKCPTALINKWADYIYEKQDNNKAKLQILTEFLHTEATKIASAGISHIHPQTDNKLHRNLDGRKMLTHTVLNNDSDRNMCKFCRTSIHLLSNCIKFKRALRKDKWRFVKINKLCQKCLLLGHGKDTCPAAPCDAENCGLPHHRLLHWPTKIISSSQCNNSNINNSLITSTQMPSTSSADSENNNNVNNNNPTPETVTNTVVTPSTCVMLKIVSVNLHGPTGVVATHALLDDGATVSLISADLANCVNLQGQPETLSIRGAWNSSIVCRSETVNFKLSNANGKTYEMRARKINELDLPVQKLSRVNLETYEHLRDVKDYLSCANVKPKLLIGQDNFHLIMTLKTVYRGINEPCATLTPLGWCLHGIVPAPSARRALTTEHELALTTMIHERASPLIAQCACTAAAPLSIATPADTCAVRRETHTCADAAMKTTLQQSNAHIELQEDKQLHELVRRSFAIDAIGVNSKPRVNKDDIRAIDIVDKSAQLINGRWTVGLPWKNYEILPDSYSNAHKRFLAVERKMARDESYAKRYKDRIDHLFENDYARKLTKEEISTKKSREWYLPHFGVDNPNKRKLRLVFDARSTVAGRSLNNYLLQGPDLLQSLFGIMLRFREKPVAIIGDIKDMFLRIKIKQEDQHALRFLWREDKTNEIHTYAMTSLIFGANCSPFIAQHIKNKNASRFIKEMPEATEAILKSHYMDDYLESVEDEHTAMKLIKEVSEIHRRGGFEIRNWISNKPEVLECTPKDTLSDVAIRIKTGCDEEPERTLGLLWFPANDTFGFDLSLKRIPPEIVNLQRIPTKRELLRIFMSIFDIFGFLAPFTVKAKIMLQNTWKTELKWDNEIAAKENNIFRDWIIELQTLQNLRIPRCYFRSTKMNERDDIHNTPCTTARESETTTELHVFCDAAPTAYCAVAYWRKISTNKEVCVSFIACKCRAAPVNKLITIPKLELQSAVIACRLADTIARENRLIVDRRYFWTDSLIVLHQIKNDTRNYKVFVANRLGEIDELSRANEWNYIPTKLNVADKATKIHTYELSADCEWFQGPRFLYTPYEEWPKFKPEKGKINDEMLQVNTITCKDESRDLPVPDPLRFSSWIRLLRCMANVLLFIEKCKSAHKAQLNTEIMQRAETELLRYSQAMTFSEEIYLLKNGKPIESNSRLRKLTPALDEFLLLRANGRIDAVTDVSVDLKRPLILDGRDHIARLIAKHYHEKAGHGCNETVVNEIRQKYWLLNLRPTVRTVASRCLLCRIKKAKPANTRLGDLPEARLAHHQRPFTHCGTDLFGPLHITNGRRHEKRYGVLFTCLTIRAVHIEVVPSLSADSFIMALRRMAARRGWPYKMYSDNGTNLKGAESELRRSFAEINESPYTKNELTNKGLEWHFICPASPHHGGAWERLILSAKTALKAVLKERAPREEVLITLLAEVENTINSRPLSHVSVDHNYPESLTPNHFLLGSSNNLPTPGEFSDVDMYKKKSWRIAQRLTDMFWRRWMREVLPALIPRQKWYNEGQNLKPGDVVVIIDPASPRNTWPKGLIKTVHPGPDGRIRVVDVKTKTGILTRPVTRLALLPTADDDDCP